MIFSDKLVVLRGATASGAVAIMRFGLPETGMMSHASRQARWLGYGMEMGSCSMWSVI